MAIQDQAILSERMMAALDAAGISRNEFEAILASFGSVPRRAKYRMAFRLIKISGWYRVSSMLERMPRPHEHLQRLEEIEKAARRLLELLGLGAPASLLSEGIGGRLHPTVTSRLLANMHIVAGARARGLQRSNGGDDIPIEKGRSDMRPDRTGETIRYFRGNDRLTLSIELISDIAVAAQRAAEEAAALVSPGRGGTRRSGRTNQSALIDQFIALYSEFRRRYPTSRRPTGSTPGGPLERFVRACLAPLFKFDRGLAHVTSAAIRKRHREMAKPKATID
jgi:hypothetical protein